MEKVNHKVTRLTEFDIYLFKGGRHFRLYEKLGAHLMNVDGRDGTLFAVWAPNAERVSVMGDFNGWNKGSHPLRVREDGSGIWEGFIPKVGKGTRYKYHIESRHNGYKADKGDPFAAYTQVAPETASVVWDIGYRWKDSKWMKSRAKKNALNAPMSTYEIHLGSWKRVPEEGNRSLHYSELAEQLPEYLAETQFTHVEMLPVMEHPFFGSWGYQVTSFFAPSSRYGEPQGLMELIDKLHQKGIGVILDWVPSHFPSDEFGLAYFDGTHLFEHADMRKGFHPDWNSYIFNYGRYEVRSFLVSSALYWLDKYHADGLRVDGVASMLYLDYSRKEGEWEANQYGGNENLEAIDFLRTMNENVYKEYPDVQTIAEESTAWPKVSRPIYDGGLGFGMKWNMGWMHDTLEYFKKDPIYRKHHQDMLTFSFCYAFTENFKLSLSHDEVVHGKGSLHGKMPGNDWEKFANLRLLYGYMWAHPGKKLLFMGSELAQWSEWNHDGSIDWHVLDYPFHQGMKQWLTDLNRVYKSESCLHEVDFDGRGFEWVHNNDHEQCVFSWKRKSEDSKNEMIFIFNMTPVTRTQYRIGVPQSGYWKEVLNSDAREYGGSGMGNLGGLDSYPIPYHGQFQSILVTLPPLSVLAFQLHKDE